MKKVKISLGTVNDVKQFVNKITQYDCDFDIISDRYVVDAKSIMGIYSLDLSKPLILNIDSDDEKLIGAIMKDIEAFLVHQYEAEN